MKGIFAALLFFPIAALGQVNKCTINGRVAYQQAPCPSGADAKTLDSGHSRSPVRDIPPEQRKSGSFLCASAAPGFFKDPDSVRIRGDALYVQSDRIIYGGPGQTAVAHIYAMTINAKNSYGGYVGEKNYWCYVTEDFNRVINVVSSLLCTPRTCKGG